MRTSLTSAFLTLFACAAMPFVAKADSIQTFNFNGTLAVGMVNGTVTINTTTGVVTGENFMAKAGAFTSVFTAAPLLQGPNVFAPNDYTAEFAGTNGGVFQLGLPTVSLVGYTGGSVCGTPGSCGLSASSYGIDLLTSGSLTAINPTPEPSSLALLGTGILGLTGVVRRKLPV